MVEKKDLEQSKAGEEPSPTPPKEEQGKEPSKPEEEISVKWEEERARITKEYEDRLSGLQSAKNGEISEIAKRAERAERDEKFTAEQLQKQKKETELLRNKLYTAEDKLAEATDNPDEARHAQAMVREAEARLVEAREKEAQLQHREYEAWANRMAERAKVLNVQYGVPIEDLVKANTEMELENIALRYAMANPKKEEPKEPEKKEESPPKFDSGVSTGDALGDTKFLEEFGKGRFNSPEDFKRAREILEKQAKGG